MMDFSWLNESELKREEEGKLVIFAPAGTDFFCNNGTVSEEGITPESLHNAPYYYTEIVIGIHRFEFLHGVYRVGRLRQ